MKIQLYDKTKINKQNMLFSNKDLKLLLFPLLVEQLLNSLMGMADTMMVSNVGSAAISAASLVDSINNLIIQVFAALAAGGTIICSQYLGNKDRKMSNRAAEQVFLSVLAISVTTMILCLMLKVPLLRFLFGNVEETVMRNSLIYFTITVFSYPCIALFQCGSAFFRAGGNSKYPMTISVISNIINILGNAILIFGFHMGISGAAIATLISRAFCMIAVFTKLRKPNQSIVLRNYVSYRPDWDMIKRTLTIGIPAGVENGMFQFGKLAIQSSVSTLGTIAIAAQAMTIILEMISGLIGMGIGIGLMTVVGQCIGAGRSEEARYYTVKLSAIAEAGMIISCLTILAITRPVTLLAGMEPASAALCIQMMIAITIVKPLVWVPAFVPVNGLRAAGDVSFPMIFSSLSMWLCRVFLCIYLIRFQGFGPMAVWIGMFADWTVRAIGFSLRFISGKWLKHQVI